MGWMGKMSLKNDKWIEKQAKKNSLIVPFENKLISEVAFPGRHPHQVISYGLSSCGYDLRLSDEDIKIFTRVPGALLDPKCFDTRHLLNADICDFSVKHFILPAHTYALGVALEKINMPNNVMGLCIGKSTYARCGIIVNMTPVEPGWSGHLTIEISNSSDADAKIYLNEGICQILFFECDKPRNTYGNRKYQNQPYNVVLPKV